MNRNNSGRAPAVGGASLLVIFAVLAMSVFAMLALSTVLSEKRMASVAVENLTAYYEADAKAEEIFARLRNGEDISGVERTETDFWYSCPVSEHQRLYVELHFEDGVWRVLRWQTVVETEEKTEHGLAVWDGREP